MTMRLIKIDQDMDAASMTAMRPLFEELADSRSDVCFDLSGVDFLDSSGVGGIVFVFKRLRERSLKVSLVNAAGQPARLLRQLKLEFMVGPSPQAAL
ncbi:STAS domain-containing protein [Roseiarcus fermentans]|nr:STAS domain-containing protein [Roseiarcus fermentans]